MYKATKTITEENFPVFKQLIEHVILKATGEPVLNNPVISNELCKRTGKIQKKIPEAKAHEIMVKVIDNEFDKANRGRRFQTLINAALNDDNSINARVHTLDSLSQYVLKNSEAEQAGNSQNSVQYNWVSYLKKNRNLTAQYHANHDSVPEQAISVLETARLPKIKIEDLASAEKSKNGALANPETINYKINKFTAFERAQPLNEADKKKLAFAGLRGGILAGILASVTIAIVRYINGENLTPFSTGYENTNFESFMRNIFTPLLLFQIIAGALLGWFCCNAATTKSKLSQNAWLFTVSFIVIVVLRQSMARDAFYYPGTYANHDLNGNIKMAGGFLGEPDFETLATGLMGAFVILFFVKALRKKKLAAFATKESFQLIMKTIIYGILAWCIIYGIYVVFTERLKIMHNGDYLFAPSFFKVDFPHPERPIFAMSLYLVYVFCLVFSIQYHFVNKRREFT